MDKTVQIMDLDVNIIDIDYFCRKIEGYLENDQLNVILLASSQLFKEAAGNEYLRGLIARADALVPGEKTVLSFYHADLLQQGGIIVNYNSLADVLEYLKKKHYTVYIVAREQNESDYIKHFVEEREYNISVIGERMEQEFEDDAIINEINSLSPDILLVDLDTPLQEMWIMEHSTKVNVRLCVGLGGIMRQVMNEYKKPPDLIRMLHLTWLYNKFCFREKLFRVKSEKIFRRAVKEYKNRKGMKNED